MYIFLLLEEADLYKAEIHSNRSEIHEMDNKRLAHRVYLVVCPHSESRCTRMSQHTGPEISAFLSGTRIVN